MIPAAALLLVLVVVLDHDVATRAAARSRPGDGQAAARLSNSGAVAAHRGLPPTLAEAQVSVAPLAAAIAVPRSFFGLSTEYWTLPLYQRRISLFERVASLLQVRGEGPMVLRIGGDSADHSFWDPANRAVPAWLFRLTPAWLRDLGRVVHRLGLRLILDLNLVTGSPASAARWARAASRALPRGSIVGFEVGNEPDIYSRRYWLAAISRIARDASGALPRKLTPTGYAEDFKLYARALSQGAARPALIGPVVAYPRVGGEWFTRLIADDRRTLEVVSAHLYPFSGCVPRGSSRYPTIARLLDESASAGVAHALAYVVSLAHGAELPFRLTEVNSITCGGRPGVSDTFANALWALDTLFELLRARVDGVNIHLRANTINAPFALNADGLTARPLLYGLIMFTRTLGPEAKLVAVDVHESAAVDLKVWAVRLAGGMLHVLLIDKGARPVTVRLNLPPTGSADVERLLAPAPASRSGVTLAGQHLGLDGRWRGRQLIEPIVPSARGYGLTLPAASAALVSISLHPHPRP